MDTLTILETEQKVKSRYNIETPDFKPCIALMLDQSFPQGPGFSRNPIAYILATEFRRLGKESEAGLKCLSLWNRQNKPPLPETEIRTIVKSAYRTNYTFGCTRNPILLNFCIDKALCHYYQRTVQRKRPNTSIQDFFSNGWPLVLSRCEMCLYLALTEAERLKGTFPGQTVFAKFDLLHRLSGVAKGGMRAYLVSLRDSGLIELKIGSPFYWQHQATQVKRIFPIPHPEGNT